MEADWKFSNIVVREARATVDEYLACCLLVAHNRTATIERRDATLEDQHCVDTLLLGLGGTYVERLNRLDYRARLPEADPLCALTSVLSYFKLLDEARKLYAWIKFHELRYCHGVSSAMRLLGNDVDASTASLLFSPIEAYAVHYFSSSKTIRYQTTAHCNMRAIGGLMLNHLRSSRDRLRLLESTLQEECVGGGAEDLRVYFSTNISREQDPLLAVPLLLEKREQPSAIVTLDPDGNGLLVKINADVDLRKIATHYAVRRVLGSRCLSTKTEDRGAVKEILKAVMA